jgi:hypothetical protein
MDVAEIAPGLWRWGGEPETASYYAEGPETVVLLDPLVPADEEERFWRALDRDVQRRGHPVLVCVTAGAHRSGAEVIRGRYGAALVGPPDSPTDGDQVAAGVLAHRVDPAGGEVGYELEPFRALVVGDVVVGTAGGLRIRPDGRDFARRMARRPIDRVLPTHGPPVRAGGAALWGAPPGVAS